MKNLLIAYKANPTSKNAKRIRDYDRKHPMSRCMFGQADSDLIADACHRADMSEA
jgi:hypothetical protein